MKQKGITLIALIITIIILLILSGVVLNFALGNNGIFKLARNTSKNWQNSVEIETSQLNNLDSQVQHIIISSRGSITINKEEYESLKLRVENLEKSLNTANETITELQKWKYVGMCENDNTIQYPENVTELYVYPWIYKKITS